LVIGVYLTIGSLLIFTDYFTIVPEEYRSLSGWVVLAYGILRCTRYLFTNRLNKTP
jgi:hypothetical protein